MDVRGPDTDGVEMFHWTGKAGFLTFHSSKLECLPEKTKSGSLHLPLPPLLCPQLGDFRYNLIVSVAPERARGGGRGGDRAEGGWEDISAVS